MNERRVVCAANKCEHAIILGARHWDKHMRFAAGFYSGNLDWDQGFIDQYGVFMTRREAWLVAEAAGQIIKRVGGDFNNETGVGKLFSENLY